MQMAQQHLLQQQNQARQAQAARQAIIAQQQYNSGMPMNMVNGMSPGLNAAQFAAMRQAGPRGMQPVPLPQHLQQQQQQAQAQLSMEQQQAQQHQQHQACSPVLFYTARK